MAVKSKRGILGLDIGAGAVKAVWLDGPNEALREEYLVQAEIPLSVTGDRAPVGAGKETLEALISCLKQLGIEPAKVRHMVSCLPAAECPMKQIRMLPLADGELEAALSFEARKHLPLDGDVLLDYQVLNRDAQGCDVLLCAASRRSVERHLDLLRSAGLKGGAIESPASALWNASLDPEGGIPGNKGTGAALHLGATGSLLTVWSPGGVFFSREIPVGGDRFTRDRANRDGLAFAEAEAQKRKLGALAPPEKNSEGGPVAPGLSLELEIEADLQKGSPSLEALGRELQRSLRFHIKESGASAPELLWVSGGPAQDSALLEALSRELRMSVSLHPAVASWGGKAAAFSIAAGLARRGAHELLPV
jgi:type IV pilus assembly protein PilM